MRFDHSGGSFGKYIDDSFTVEYDFTNDLNGDTLAASSNAAIYNSSDVNKTASMISLKSVVSPSLYFDVSDGTTDIYSIKLLGRSAAGKTYTKYLNCEVYGDITLNSKLGDPNANSYCSLTQANEYIQNKYGHSTVWDDLTVEGKKRVLIQAAKDINTMNFKEDKYYDAQALEFPRDDHDVITGNCATPFTINSFTNSNLYSAIYMEYPDDYWKNGSCHITEGTPLNDIRIISTSSGTDGKVTMSVDFTATPTADTKFTIFSPIDKNILAAQCEQALNIVTSSSMSELDVYKNKSAKEVRIGDVMVQFSSSDSRRFSVVSKESKKLLSSYLEYNYKVSRC